jgi:hypothetical protein
VIDVAQRTKIASARGCIRDPKSYIIEVGQSKPDLTLPGSLRDEKRNQNLVEIFRPCSKNYELKNIGQCADLGNCPAQPQPIILTENFAEHWVLNMALKISDNRKPSPILRILLSPNMKVANFDICKALFCYQKSYPIFVINSKRPLFLIFSFFQIGCKKT